MGGFPKGFHPDTYGSFVGLDTDIFYADGIAIWENDPMKGSRKTIVNPLTGEILAPEEKYDDQVRFEDSSTRHGSGTGRIPGDGSDNGLEENI